MRCVIQFVLIVCQKGLPSDHLSSLLQAVESLRNFFFLLQGFKRFSCRLPWTPSRLMAMQGSHRCTHTLDLPTGAKRILRTSALYKSLSEKGFPHRPQFPLSGRERTPWQRQQGSDEGIHKGSISLFYNYQDADDILVVGFGNQMLVGKKQQWQIGINTPLC